jgi:hypothetical protein
MKAHNAKAQQKNVKIAHNAEKFTRWVMNRDLMKKSNEEERVMVVLPSTGATLVPEHVHKETQAALEFVASKSSLKAKAAMAEAKISGGRKLCAENEARFSKGNPPPPLPSVQPFLPSCNPHHHHHQHPLHCYHHAAPPFTCSGLQECGERSRKRSGFCFTKANFCRL